MLTKLRLVNFRCFRDHTVPLLPTTVIVGKNNAGKSSVIEALRLVAAVTNRKGASFTIAPPWLETTPFRYGLAPSVGDLGIRFDSIFYRYSDPPARVVATFAGNVEVTIHIGTEEKIFATVSHHGNWLSSGGKFLALGLRPLHVLPQIGPLLPEEIRLTDERIAEKLGTNLSSRHFRNQLVRMPDAFGRFSELAEATWHGLQLSRPREQLTGKGTLLSLEVREGDFVGEVGTMGHGLQMWLQTLWFVSRTQPDGTVVLDEPDVYMHPDLQRSLFRLVRARFPQSVVATHSVEIMAEADPSEILIVDRNKARSQFASGEPGVQALIDNIGGIHNVHLARLWSAKKALLVEGQDVAILKHLHAKLFPRSESPIDAIPSIPLGGWSGWNYALGSIAGLKNAVGERVISYCLFDSDFRPIEEIQARRADAEHLGIALHVWRRKEIENYLLVPRAIRRILAARAGTDAAPAEAEIWRAMLQICEEERHATEDSLAAAIVQWDRSVEVSTANRRARARVAECWGSEEGRLACTPGKVILGRLSDRFQQQLGFSFGAPAVARQLRADEIPPEMAAVLTAIEAGRPFSTLDELNQPVFGASK
ncbi:MAG: ATP-dependent nuclease [Terriglobales bacterium]